MMKDSHPSQCGRAATQRDATAPRYESLPSVARFLAEKTTFSPLAVQGQVQAGTACANVEPEYAEISSVNEELSRRTFLSVLGAGLLISVNANPLVAQRRQRGGGRGLPVQARIHLGQDGTITVLTGKIEMGQGARAELAQAAAEELRVPFDRIRMQMADTSLVPDDGITAGSRTTPSTVPAVRQGAAAARTLLIELASRRWDVAAEAIEVRDGRITNSSNQQTLDYADLAQDQEVAALFRESVPPDIELTPVDQWKVLGRSIPRPNRSDLVKGSHKFPSDLSPEGVLHGKVLRPPTYGAELISVDLSPAKAIEGAVVVQDGDFVGVAAPTSFAAQRALDAIAKTATWRTAPHPSSREVFDYLRSRSREIPPNPFAQEMATAAHTHRATYNVAYVQHAPLEPRVALAEWKDGGLTVWTGTQNPFGYHRELAGAFQLQNEQVRVIVPDFGSGFGGKHSGEAAIEAARLARAAGKPVSLKWTREEEFTWAYFRPAAVIDVEGSLDGQNQLTSWHFLNINSGGAALDTPYRIEKANCRYVPSESPVRQGSYRVLAATANNFARESFMDEMATIVGMDPLDFRLAHLEHGRLRDVLVAAAERFDWSRRFKQRDPDVGVGLACGTEKGSYVAACVEISIDRSQKEVVVRQVCEVFECGAIINRDNLLAQVEGCIVMGMGPALREEMRFRDGEMRNAKFSDYRVPRFSDLPELDIHLLERDDLASAGGGETPIIAIAPAIANAVFHATGSRIRQMPIRLSAASNS